MASLKGRKNLIWILATFFVAIIAFFCFAPDVLARPGGGGSYGGGGGSSGGGGGDISGLIYLVIAYPEIGIPLLIIAILIAYFNRNKGPQESINSGNTPAMHQRKIRRANHSLTIYKNEVDPNFSSILFEDFVQHLYYQFHHWRSKPEFRNLYPYLDANVMEYAVHHNKVPVDVTELVIGNLNLVNYSESDTHDYIAAEIDANYTETRKGHTNRLWIIDQWIFRRKKGVKSKGPDDMFDLHCPNCGSNLEVSPTGQCGHCSMVVEPGTKHWELVKISHLKRQVKRGLELGTYEQERGTDYPTVVHEHLRQMGQVFAHRHQITDLFEYMDDLKKQIILPVFENIYSSWAENDWKKARPLLTDNLFRSHNYWIETYKKAGLTNKLDDLEITKLQPVKLQMDKFYEAVTFRIHASVKDYLVNEQGKVVAGNPRSPRHFSEYWTFIRQAGTEKSLEDYDVNSCPNCGAPVDMGMAAVCGYCNSKVSTGEFNWILGKIVQDEVYVG